MPTKPIVPVEHIERRIYLIRGRRVMLDRDLAEIYGVSTKRLNEQVRRNADRFPHDFMFRLSMAEATAVICSRSQIATLKRGQNIKYRPSAFTEHGAVMLASVLNSPVAVQASIHVVRAFVRLRQMLASNKNLARKLEELARAVAGHDERIQGLFWAIRRLMAPPVRPRLRIGFRPQPE